MNVDIQRRHSADEPAPFVVLDAAELPPRAESVSAARRFTRASFACLDVPGARMDDLVLGVSEAFANAVGAHHRNGVEAAILVRATVPIEAVGVEIEDHAGGGIDLTRWEARPILTDRDHLGSDRGWGIQLIRTFIELVTYKSTANGMLVRLAVRR